MANAFAAFTGEEKLQVNDRTRLSAEKSFVSPLGTTALTTITVTPGLDGSPASVFSSSGSSDWYMDWIFTSWTFDIITDYNDSIDFYQDGEKTATLTEDTYTLSELVTHIQTVLNAVSGISGTFSVSVDYKNRMTVSNDTASFYFMPKTGSNLENSLLPHIGFPVNGEASKSHQGNVIEYSHKRIAVAVGNGTQSNTEYGYIKLYSKEGDALFSSDGDLITWEPDIMKYVKSGRNTYKDIHREAQEQIIYWLDREGYVNVYGRKYNKFDIIDFSEVNEWSAFLALSIIYWGISNKTDDVFLNKHFEFLKKAQEARSRAVLRLDTNEDGKIDLGEDVDIRFGTVVTR